MRCNYCHVGPEDLKGMNFASDEQNPNEAFSYNLLGRLQAEQGDKEGAIASLKKAVELDPEATWSAQLLNLQSGQADPAR